MKELLAQFTFLEGFLIIVVIYLLAVLFRRMNEEIDLTMKHYNLQSDYENLLEANKKLTEDAINSDKIIDELLDGLNDLKHKKKAIRFAKRGGISKKQ
jgi:hypothetical protein